MGKSLRYLTKRTITSSMFSKSFAIPIFTFKFDFRYMALRLPIGHLGPNETIETLDDSLNLENITEDNPNFIKFPYYVHARTEASK